MLARQSAQVIKSCGISWVSHSAIKLRAKDFCYNNNTVKPILSGHNFIERLVKKFPYSQFLFTYREGRYESSFFVSESRQILLSLIFLSNQSKLYLTVNQHLGSNYSFPKGDRLIHV